MTSTKVWTHWDFPIEKREAFTPTDLVRDTYVAERKKIVDLESLHAFIKRWHAIWRIDLRAVNDAFAPPPEFLVYPDDSSAVLHPDVDVDKLLSVLLLPVDRQGELFFEAGTPSKGDFTQTAVLNILLPQAAAVLSATAHHYRVPSDIAWDQMFSEVTLAQ
jgi:hypothetical protein